MQAFLTPPTPDDLVAAQLRLAEAKDADDAAQADLRAAKGEATKAKKELATALRGWRQVVRGIDRLPDDQFEDDDDADDAGDDREDDAEPARPEPVHA